MTELRWGSHTDEGRVRDLNEDSFVADDSLFAVADGMGGHAAGEVASAVAIETLQANAGQTADTIVEAIRLANRAVIERAAGDPSMKGMGTTLSVVALIPAADGGDSDEIVVANVGDSRVYRLHDGELEQLTDDHSLVGDLVREGRITPAEARVHPNRNIVTKAIGNEHDVIADSWIVDPHTGDRYLLCSDGLTDEVEDDAIARVLRTTKDPAAAAKELVDLANAAGGRDNITAVVVDVVDDGGRGAAASAVLARQPARTSSSAPSMVHEGPGGGPATAAIPAVGTSAEPRPRRLTWRVAVFIVAIVVVLGVAIGGTVWFARNTYYVGLDDDEQVTIYRGRPGGVLFIKPTVEDTTEYSVGDIAPARRDEVEAGHEASSLAEAERYVQNIATTTTTSTTTTTTTTSTTAPAAPTTTPTSTP